MLRVLRIITTIEPEVGGPSHSAVNAAIAEQCDQIATTLVATRAREREVDSTRLSDAGVRCYQFRRVRFAASLARRWGFSWGLIGWILRHSRSFDVIHVHYVWSVGGVLGVVMGLVLGRPVIMTPHESLTEFDIDGSRSRARRLQKQLVRRILLRGVDTVVVASDLELRDSDSEGDRFVVISHPVVERARHHQWSRANSTEVRVGFIGRLHPKKRVEALLEAFGALPGHVTLVIAGSEPESELRRLQARAAQTIYGARVQFVGFVPAAARDAFFDDLDFLAMPSSYECFGMVAAEAMSAGLPVVVTEQTGVAAIVRSHAAGRVVSAADDDTLVEALLELSSSSELRRELGENARRASDEVLTLDAYRIRIHDVYDAALTRRNGVVPAEPLQNDA